MLHRAVFDVGARHAGDDAAHVVHFGFAFAYSDSHVAGAAEDDAAVAVFFGAAGAAGRMLFSSSAFMCAPRSVLSRSEFSFALVALAPEGADAAAEAFFSFPREPSDEASAPCW